MDVQIKVELCDAVKARINEDIKTISTITPFGPSLEQQVTKVVRDYLIQLYSQRAVDLLDIQIEYTIPLGECDEPE